MADFITQVQAWRKLTERQVRSAAARAANRALVSVRAEAARRIREEISLKAGEIKDALTITRANPRDSLAVMKATLTAKGRPIPLYRFGARPKRMGKRTGVTVKVKKERKLVQGGFIARMRTGHVGVFKRKGPKRLPIKELFSLSVVSVFRGAEFMAALRHFASARFKENFSHELKFKMGQGE